VFSFSLSLSLRWFSQSSPPKPIEKIWRSDKSAKNQTGCCKKKKKKKKVVVGQ